MQVTKERKDQYKKALLKLRPLSLKALSMWKGIRRDADALGRILAQMQGKLSKAGCKGAFSWWLRENEIPRSTAYRMIDKHFGVMPKRKKAEKAKKESAKPISARDQIIKKLKALPDETSVLRYLNSLYSEVVPRAAFGGIQLQPIPVQAAASLGFKKRSPQSLKKAFGQAAVIAAGKAFNQAVVAAVGHA